MNKYETKNYMEYLKHKFNAWLVVNVSETEDNGEYIEEFLIFNDDGTFTCFTDEKLRKFTFLGYYKTKLYRISELLEGEKKERLLNILKDVKDIKR